jgi:hypothetical protein
MEDPMLEAFMGALVLLGAYNTWVLRTVKATTARLQGSVHVLVTRSDLNHDRSMVTKEMVDRHERHITRLMAFNDLLDE